MCGAAGARACVGHSKRARAEVVAHLQINREPSAPRRRPRVGVSCMTSGCSHAAPHDRTRRISVSPPHCWPHMRRVTVDPLLVVRHNVIWNRCAAATPRMRCASEQLPLERSSILLFTVFVAIITECRSRSWWSAGCSEADAHAPNNSCMVS